MFEKAKMKDVIPFDSPAQVETSARPRWGPVPRLRAKLGPQDDEHTVSTCTVEQSNASPHFHRTRSTVLEVRQRTVIGCPKAAMVGRLDQTKAILVKQQ